MNKNVIYICMMGLLLALCLPMRAFAQSGDGFRLDESGMVTLDSSHAAKEGIASFSFTLTVEPEGAETVGFEFAGDIAKIMEYHYHAEENKLNVYVAGTESLFPEGIESLSIGKVVVRDGNGKNGRAKVGIEEGSLQFVYGLEARTMEDVDIPEAVQIGGRLHDGTLTPPTPTQVPPTAPTQTPQPPQPPAPESNPEGDASGGESQPAGTQVAGGSSSDKGGGIPRVPIGNAVSSNKGNESQESSAEESSSAQETVPEVEDTPEPSEESPVSTEEPDEEEMETSGSESQYGEGNQTQGEGGFLKDMKPILIGFLIAAAVIGIGAVVIVYLIKPKRK